MKNSAFFWTGAFCVLLSGVPASAQEVSPAVHHDVSPPLRAMSRPPLAGPKHEKPLFRLERPVSNQTDPVVQTSAGPLVGTTGGLNIAGVGDGDYGFAPNAAPPDTNGAVGATQYVQWVNESFAIFDKTTGALIHGPVAGNSLWSGFGGACETNNDGDPIVQYDKAAQRWVLTQFSVSTTPYLQCVAVSTTSDATGTYNRYSFSQPNFPDYPKLGVWPDAYYVSFNMFNGNSFAGGRACAFDRAAMLAGTAATQVCFQLSTAFGGLLPSDLDGSTAPPAGSPNFFVAFDTNSLDLWKFHTDFVTPANSTFTGPTNIPVAAFSAACGGGTCIPQAGTNQKLDSLADRLMYRLAYRNFGDHEALVANHSVTVGTSVGVRWYELRSPNGAPTVFQQGTYAPDSNYRWMGSIAMDQSGDIALGYSVSSSSMNPAIRYTGRVPTDAPGTLQMENNIKTGTGSQTNGLNRWGDYSAMTIDPVDDCTFFYTNEYLKANGSFNWSTRIASFKFPSCGPATVPPAPTGLAATPGNTQVSLSWTGSTGAASYTVLRSTSGVPYSAIQTGVTTTSYTDTGLTNGTTYSYEVEASNSVGTSGPSNQASATPCVLPGAPTGLSATGGTTQVSLTWKAPTGGASSYNVKRSASSGGPYSTIQTGVTTTSYNDAGLANGTTYYYVVSAVTACGEGSNSTQASAITAPVAPTGLTATPGNNQVSLSWTGSTGAASYTVLRSTTGGTGYLQIASGVTAKSYTDATAANGTMYFYVVRAVNSGGTSGNSNEASAKPQAGTAAPTNLGASGAKRRVNLSWTQSTTPGVTGNNVYRATSSGGQYTLHATLPPSTSYSDTSLTRFVTYYYYVTAVAAGVESPPSNVASAASR